MSQRFQAIKRAALAASLALAMPLAALAQPGPGGPMGGPMGGPGMRGGQGMEHGHGMQGMEHGRGMHGGPGMHEMREGMGGGMRMLHRLNLTEAQRDQVFELMHKQAPAMRERAKALHKARKELRDLSMSAQFDDGKAKALADTIAASSAEMALMRARTGNAIFQLLTPEQRKQAEELRARHEQRAMMGGQRPGPAR